MYNQPRWFQGFIFIQTCYPSVSNRPPCFQVYMQPCFQIHIPRCFHVHMPRCFQVSIEGDQYYQVHISSGCDEEHDHFYSETTYFDCLDHCLAQATSDGQKRVSNPESDWRKRWIACILRLYLSLYCVQCCFTIHVYVPVVIPLR